MMILRPVRPASPSGPPGEAAGGVEVEDGVGVEEIGGDHLLDDLGHEILRDLLVGHRLVVLGGDEHGVHALGRMAPPSFLYSMVTWVLPSGLTTGRCRSGEPR